jgi:tetratricopeptide (TPR) repeat protein
MKAIKYLFVLSLFMLCMAHHTCAQSTHKNHNILVLSPSLQNQMDSLVNIGNSYYMLGQLRISIEYYNKALVLNPNCAKAFFNRGNSFFDLGETKPACDDWLKAALLGQEEAEDMIIKNCK